MGKSNKVTLRAAAALTDSYVAGSVLGADVGKPEMVRVANQLILLVDFTIGSLTSAEIKVEFGDGDGTFRQEAAEGVDGTTGVITAKPAVRQLTASGSYEFALPIKCSQVRVSAKGTGTVTGSSLAISAVYGDSN